MCVDSFWLIAMWLMTFMWLMLVLVFLVFLAGFVVVWRHVGQICFDSACLLSCFIQKSFRESPVVNHKKVEKYHIFRQLDYVSFFTFRSTLRVFFVLSFCLLSNHPLSTLTLPWLRLSLGALLHCVYAARFPSHAVIASYPMEPKQNTADAPSSLSCRPNPGGDRR